MRLLQPSSDFLERVLPACRLELAVPPDQRLAQAFRVVGEVKPETSFRAQKLAVDSGMIAIVRAKDFVVAHAERRFAAIRAMGAWIWNVGHFPGPRLIAIRAARQRTNGANIDAHPAFFASEFAGLVGHDDRVHTASAHA